MSVSATLGVPVKLQTTYDILGFTQYQLSAYSSVFHIMAMRAAAALATAAGEVADAANFTAAADRARDSLDTLQWVGANKSTWTTTPDTYCPEDYKCVVLRRPAQFLENPLGVHTRTHFSPTAPFNGLSLSRALVSAASLSRCPFYVLFLRHARQCSLRFGFLYRRALF